MKNQILIGDCLASLKSMESESVDCVVTSPPYWGLRDYGHEDQLGSEPDFNQYIEKLVAVFEECHRVLKPSGTFWLNLGDTYNGRKRGNTETRKNAACSADNAAVDKKPQQGLKNKDLIGIPWRVAFALQDSGWYLRNEIIWHKPNAMPDGAKDRLTRDHENIFLFTKNERYFFDAEPIKEPSKYYGDKRSQRPDSRRGSGMNQMSGDTPKMKNKRTVWSVTTKPFKGGHFAPYPHDLIEPCILAGCPEGGVVLDPFGGSGTTGFVAARNGRQYVLCELNPEYAAIAEDRINNELFGDLL